MFEQAYLGLFKLDSSLIQPWLSLIVLDKYIDNFDITFYIIIKIWNQASSTAHSFPEDLQLECLRLLKKFVFYVSQFN